MLKLYNQSLFGGCFLACGGGALKKAGWVLSHAKVSSSNELYGSFQLSDKSVKERMDYQPLRSVPLDSLGTSILCRSNRNDRGVFKTEHELLGRRIVIAKVLSLSSSGLGLIMAPVITNYLWESAAECPSIMAFAVVANAFLILLSLTPFLLQFLVKRFVVDIYYNPRSKIFTSVHYGFWINKKVLRFLAEDVVDAAVAPELKKLWLPLSTVFVYGRPLLLSLNISAYKDKQAFLELTKNVKIPVGSD